MKKIIAVVLALAIIAQLAIFGVSAEPAPLWVGDANCDGVRTIDDATYVQKQLAGMVTMTKRQAYSADADKNGMITINDATMIQKYCAGVITLPEEYRLYASYSNFQADYDSGKAYPGTEVTFFVAGSGIQPLSYEFLIDNEVVRERAESPEFSYVFKESGDYIITFRVYNGFDEYAEGIRTYTVKDLTDESEKLRIKALYADTLYLDCGRIITFTAEAEWGTAPYEFAFDLDNGSQTQAFSEVNTFTVISRMKIGNHTLKVWVKDADGNQSLEIRTFYISDYIMG